MISIVFIYLSLILFCVVDCRLKWHNQLFFTENETFSAGAGIYDSSGFCQVNSLFRASLFAQSAVNTTQHIDFVDFGIFFFAVQMFFFWFTLGSFHRDSFGRARQSTESAGGAAFSTFFVPHQCVSPAINRTEWSLLFRITDGNFLFENVFVCSLHSIKNSYHINTLPNIHFFVSNLFFSAR